MEGIFAPPCGSGSSFLRANFFHAAEQLKAAFDTAYGNDSARAQAQFEKYRHILRHEDEGVEKVLRAPQMKSAFEFPILAAGAFQTPFCTPRRRSMSR